MTATDAVFMSTRQLQDVRLGMYMADNVLGHVQACAARRLPMIDGLRGSIAGRCAIVVAPGPSLDDPAAWRRIAKLRRAGAAIIAIKEAQTLLAARGIRADFSVSIDPKADQVAKTPVVPGVTYLVASVCHPALFDHLAEAGAEIRVFHSVTGIDGEIDLYATGFPVPQDGLWLAQTGLSVANRAIACAYYLGARHVHLAGAPFGLRLPEGENPPADAIDPASLPNVYAAGVTGRQGGGKVWCSDRGAFDGRPWICTKDMVVSAASVARLIERGMVSTIGDSLASAMAARPDLRECSVRGVV